MKRDWMPINGRKLLDQRKRGVLPAGTVNVVMDVVQDDTFSWPVLTLRSDEQVERMDWRMLVNLDVWVWADDTQALPRVRAVVRDIAAVAPRSLHLRFLDRSDLIHDIDCGTGTHRAGLPEHGIPAEHQFTFCPINSTGTLLGNRLCTALRRTNLNG